MIWAGQIIPAAVRNLMLENPLKLFRPNGFKTKTQSGGGAGRQEPGNYPNNWGLRSYSGKDIRCEFAAKLWVQFIWTSSALLYKCTLCTVFSVGLCMCSEDLIPKSRTSVIQNSRATTDLRPIQAVVWDLQTRGGVFLKQRCGVWVQY